MVNHIEIILILDPDRKRDRQPTIGMDSFRRCTYMSLVLTDAQVLPLCKFISLNTLEITYTIKYIGPVEAFWKKWLGSGKRYGSSCMLPFFNCPGLYSFAFWRDYLLLESSKRDIFFSCFWCILYWKKRRSGGILERVCTWNGIWLLVWID